MIVRIKCQKCSIDYTKEINMIPIGNLVLSEDWTQSQEYKCGVCNILVQVTVNTTVEDEQ